MSTASQNKSGSNAVPQGSIINSQKQLGSQNVSPESIMDTKMQSESQCFTRINPS